MNELRFRPRPRIGGCSFVSCQPEIVSRHGNGIGIGIGNGNGNRKRHNSKVLFLDAVERNINVDAGDASGMNEDETYRREAR